MQRLADAVSYCHHHTWRPAPCAPCTNNARAAHHRPAVLLRHDRRRSSRAWLQQQAVDGCCMQPRASTRRTCTDQIQSSPGANPMHAGLLQSQRAVMHTQAVYTEVHTPPMRPKGSALTWMLPWTCNTPKNNKKNALMASYKRAARHTPCMEACACRCTPLQARGSHANVQSHTSRTPQGATCQHALTAPTWHRPHVPSEHRSWAQRAQRRSPCKPHGGNPPLGCCCCCCCC